MPALIPDDGGSLHYRQEFSNANPREERKTRLDPVDRRATAILKALASGPRRLGVSELADRLGLARPTVHGLLQTLQSHGFVEQDEYSEKYQLGPGLLQLGYSSSTSTSCARDRSPTPTISHADRGRGEGRRDAWGQASVVVHHVFRPDARSACSRSPAASVARQRRWARRSWHFRRRRCSRICSPSRLPRLPKQTVNQADLQRELEHHTRTSGVATEREEAVAR